MRKILLSAVALALSFCVIGVADMMAAAFTPVLYGNLIYTRTWGDEDATRAGVYRFNASNAPEVALEYHPGEGNIYANGGAVYADGKYYVLTHVPNTGKIQKNILYTYDADTWTLISEKEIPLSTSASDLTWCPVDNKVYGVFTNSTSSGYVFGTLCLDDGVVSEIKEITLMDGNRPVSFLVVAADKEGDIYGIASTGDLYRFDRLTGDYTCVGPTGFVPALWNQSGCFDFTTGELYWAACNADLSALFIVDTSTGAATRVCTFADDEEFVGLYSLSSVADLKGPQAVGSLTVVLDRNVLSGTISFDMPSVTISGDAVSGSLDYTVEDGGTVIMSGTASAGATVERDITFAEGLHTLVVYAASSEGRGASSRLTVYAGDDTPAVPSGVSAVKTGDEIVISWNAVADGAHRGYVDPSAVTYTVTRMPDAQVVASGISSTSCKDTALPSLLGDYTYEVAASYAGKQGSPAVSAPLTLGSTLSAPVAFDLTDEAQFKFFTVIDANADGTTWQWSINGTRCNYHRTNNTDDWLVTPPVELKAGHRYKIEIEGRSGSNRYKEMFEVMAGPSPHAEALAIPVIGPTELTAGNRETVTAVFTPDADGPCRFGIHGISEKYMNGIYIYSFSVSEPVAPGAPVAPSALVAEAAPLGRLETTVSAIAPVEAVDGSAIVSLLKAEIVNLTTGNTVSVVDNPEPGAQVSVTDVAPVNGFNEYSVVFYTEAGKGYPATVSVYVGEDIPQPVSDVVLRQEGDNAVLVWKAPAEGVNGGYVNPDRLSYRVALSSSSVTVAPSLTECTFTDSSQPTDGQRVLQYTVYATSAAGTSSGTRSNSLTFGTPYTAPFVESFSGGREDMSPWVTIVEEGTGYPSWTPTTKGYDNIDYSQDGDAGWVKYSSNGTVTLVSPLVDIAPLRSPMLKFWMMSPDGPVALDVMVSADQGLTWDILCSLQAECAAWECVTFGLDRYASANRLQVAFKAATRDYNDMMLDNIRLTDSRAIDLGVVSFSGPERVVGGTVAAYSVRLLNEGTQTAENYTVDISAGGRLLASATGAPVEPDGFVSLSVDVPVPVNVESIGLTAAVTVDGDEYGANDEAALTVSVDAPRLPVVGSLSAVNAGGAVRLVWERPAEERNPSPFTDSLESLDPWDFGGVSAGNPYGAIGDYRIYDADGGATVAISSWAKHPNAYAPMAFQVAKAGKYPGLDLSTYGVNARSGACSFVVWGAAEGASSDWLILPELFPGETTVAFWAHAAAVSYGQIRPEKIEILYSSTGCDIADFTTYGEPFEVPNGWSTDSENGFRKYEVTLPADAKYAAIRASLSTQDNKAIVIDDITFVPASSPMEQLEIRGYNIYRDGERIAWSDVEEYLDTTSGDGKTHVYNVTTAYHVGESAFSNDADVFTSGIEAVADDTACTPVRYYNLQGIAIRTPVRGNTYIVRLSDGTTAKRVF